MVVQIPWREMARGLFIPTLSASTTFWTSIVAILGTTISPYLFFWQASQEVEDVEASTEREPLKYAPRQAENRAAAHSAGHLYRHGFFKSRRHCDYRDHRGHIASPGSPIFKLLVKRLKPSDRSLDALLSAFSRWVFWERVFWRSPCSLARQLMLSAKPENCRLALRGCRFKPRRFMRP